MCVCIIVSFSSFLFFGRQKRSHFTNIKDKLELFNHLFYYTKIALVLVEPQRARIPPNVKFTWTLLSFFCNRLCKKQIYIIHARNSLC